MRTILGISLMFCLCFLGVDCFSSEIHQGMDVSVYQGSIDFQEVKEHGFDSVYIRAGTGASGEDRLFVEHYEKAQEAGFNLGFYYYVTATTVEEAENQAEEFARLISTCDYELRPAMDYETFSGVTVEQSIEIALSFLEKLESLIETKPVVYTNANNVKNRWGNSLSDYPLWVADYAHLAEPETYRLPESSGWKEWSGYQYSDSLTISGISGNVDGDLFKEGIFVGDSGKSTTEKVTHQVKKGDTLWSIGKKYGVTLSELVEINHIEDENLIYVGETIKIPSNKVYIVKSGDTLYKLATTFGTTVSAIATKNQISNPNLIYEGERLNIPT